MGLGTVQSRKGKLAGDQNQQRGRNSHCSEYRRVMCHLREFSPKKGEVQWKGTELHFLMIFTNKRRKMPCLSKKDSQIIYRFNANSNDNPNKLMLKCLYNERFLWNKMERRLCSDKLKKLQSLRWCSFREKNKKGNRKGQNGEPWDKLTHLCHMTDGALQGKKILGIQMHTSHHTLNVTLKSKIHFTLSPKYAKQNCRDFEKRRKNVAMTPGYKAFLN